MIFLNLILALLFSASLGAEPLPKLLHSPECILNAILAHKQLSVNPAAELPKIFYASEVTLQQFQDAIEPQWNLRPDQITNAYVIDKNEIYLIDDPTYYSRTERFLEDSLAHELTHFIQVVYRHWDLQSGDDSLEYEAVHTQTWFRDTYMKPGLDPCSPKSVSSPNGT